MVENELPSPVVKSNDSNIKLLPFAFPPSPKNSKKKTLNTLYKKQKPKTNDGWLDEEIGVSADGNSRIEKEKSDEDYLDIRLRQVA